MTAPTQQKLICDVVMKDVTCYKDASEHDRVLQWEQWCPCVQGGGQLDVTS